MAQIQGMLSSRALVRIAGEGWRTFLQGLLTQNVERSAPGELRYAALLNPQGRLLHDLFVLDSADEAMLDVAASGREDLVRRLTSYRLRAKVAIVPVEGRVEVAFGGATPAQGEGWRADPRLASLGWRRIVRPAGPGADAEGAYRTHRITLGVADPSVEGRENDYPIELNLDLLNGIDFRKGCFVGQETTSRMHRRSASKTRLVRLRCEGAPLPVGAEVLAGPLRAGETRAAVPGLALALLRLDRSADGLRADGREAAPDPPDWLARFLQPDPERIVPGTSRPMTQESG